MARVFQRDGNWWVDFKDAQGVRRRKKIGPNKRVAKEVLDGILGNVARRQHLGIIEESSIAFADFAEEWKRRARPTLKQRSQERWFGIVDKHLKPAFPVALRSITQSSVEAYVSRRLEATPCRRRSGVGERASVSQNATATRRISPSTVNREMTVLKHILARAVEWEYLGDNRAAKVKPLRETPGRTRFLSLEEIDRLLAACDASESPYLRPFAVVAMNTGMRRNEILSLVRKSVDFANSLVTLSETKGGETRHVYLNQAANEALRSLPVRIDGRCLPLGPNQVTMLFVRAAKRANLEDCRLHDLRHTFASYQAMAGVAGRGLQALLGHKDARMTMRYSHLSDAYLRAAVNGVVLGTSQDGPSSQKNGTYLAPEQLNENVIAAK
jgi:integrase